MQDGQTGDITEARSCHVIIVTHAYDIRIGIVGIDDGVFVLTVAEIR